MLKCEKVAKYFIQTYTWNLDKILGEFFMPHDSFLVPQVKWN